MIRNLINFGLATIPFIIWNNMDSRLPKEILCMGILLAISLIAICQGTIRRFPNKWMIAFIGYLFICIWFSPPFKSFFLFFFDGKNISLTHRTVQGLWLFKSLLYFLICFLAVVVIASQKVNTKNIFFIISLTGFIMSLYVILQRLHLDQFFSKSPEALSPDVNYTTQATITGTLGQSTIVSAFIAVTVPIMIYLRKYIWAIVAAIAIIVTESRMAMASLFLSSSTYMLWCERRIVKLIGALILSSGIIFTINYIKNQEDFNYKAQSNGRIEAWKNIWEDFTTPPIPMNDRKYTITGFGPGAFEYTHSIRKNNRWWQAHNEYLESLYDFGVLGVAVLLMAILTFWKMIDKKVEENKAMLSSLFCIALLSMGTFPFRIWPILFISVVFIGVLHGKH